MATKKGKSPLKRQEKLPKGLSLYTVEDNVPFPSRSHTDPDPEGTEAIRQNLSKMKVGSSIVIPSYKLGRTKKILTNEFPKYSIVRSKVTPLGGYMRLHRKK